jgi:hypothetical protein
MTELGWVGFNKHQQSAFGMLLLGCMFTTNSIAAQPETRTNQVSDGGFGLAGNALQPGAMAGESIAIKGSIVIVGAPNNNNGMGEAYICDGGTLPDPWANNFNLADLISLTSNAAFGTDVALLETGIVDRYNMLAVASAPGMGEGMAFVFGRNNDMGGWTLLESFENTTPGSLGNGFGISVSIDSACVVVGDPTANKQNGSAHVYLIDSSGTIDANPIIIDGSAFLQGGEFGNDVDVLEDMIVIGAPGPLGGTDADGGRAYLYRITTDSQGTSIDLENTIHGELNTEFRFGTCVAFGSQGKNKTLAVGMPGMNLMPHQNGTVEIYRDSGDGIFNHEASVVAELLQFNDNFGSSVDIDGDLLIVGAPLASTTAVANGVAYIYRNSPSSGSWSPEWMINPTIASGGNRFGTSVATDSGNVVIGAPNLDHFLTNGAGIAFLYEEPIDDEWQNDPRLPQPMVFDRGSFSTGAPQPGFGSAIAVTSTNSGDIALIGDPNSSQVHIFRREGEAGSPWVDMMLQLLPPDVQNPPYEFGQVIELVGDLAIIGAPYEGSGEVYIYQDISGAGMNWVHMQTITPTYSNAGNFGAKISVIEVGGTVIQLAISDTGSTLDTENSGRVHLYSWENSVGFSLSHTLTDPNYVSGGWSEFGTSIALSESPEGASLLIAVGDNANGGHVDLFEYSAGEMQYQQTLNPPNSFTEFFGNTVAMDNELVVVGSNTWIPYANTGRAFVFSRSNPLGNRSSGWIPYAFTYALESTASPSGGVADGFGDQIEISSSPRRILISAPLLDYIDFNAGGVYIFSPSATQTNAWNIDAVLGTVTSNAGDAAGPFAVLHNGMSSTILVGCPGSSPILPVPRRVLDFEFSDTVSWMWQGGGNMSTSSLWSGDTNGANGRFSLFFTDFYDINFDIQQWAGSLEIAFNDVTFDLLGYTNREITDDLLVSSPAAQDMAIVDIRDGDLLIGNDVVLGPAPGTPDPYDSIGGLHFHAARITVGNRMEISQGSSLLMELMPPSSRNDDDPPSIPTPTITADQVIAGGTLLVEIRTEGDIFLAGDQFELIASTSAPIQGSFDAIVLPGLPDGLAFQLEDVPGLRGPSGSTLTATVIPLAGLLDFGDPNSVAVTGDATGIEIVDLTGDFAEEICVTFAGAPGQLVIFENDGAGGVAQQIVIPTGDEPVDITSGDFDGDGTNDLAVANRLSQDVTLYYNVNNNPSDGFDTLDLNVDGPPTCLAGINANYDSYGDLVVGLNDTDGDGNGYWVIYLGANSLRMPGGMGEGGGIAPSGIPLGADPANEEDQKDYVFAGNQSNGKTSVAKNATVLLGSVTLELDEYATGANPGGISTGDLNGDGEADLAVTSNTNGTVAILQQNTTIPGDFLPAVFIPVGDQPTRITTVDFDSDGNLDLATIVLGTTPSGVDELVVRILQGDGNLSFTSIDVAVGEGVVLIDAGDVSGNGENELVTIGDGALMRGSSSPLLSLRKINNATCPGDFDGTGSVGIDDLLTLLGEFGSCTENCQGDMDGDNDVDIDDMLALISVFGPCPR